MQLALPLTPDSPAGPVRPAPLEIAFVRRRGARRYILRVMDDGTLRVTVPWWGSKREARQFAESQEAWVMHQRAQRAVRAAARSRAGATVLVDGVAHALAVLGEGRLAIGDAVLDTRREADGDPGAVVHAWLRRRAVAQLPGELMALAERHAVAVTRVAIRNQRSRWGSCSRQGTISLNWRLVQTPPFVREYVLVHELMHRREMNHSARFWRLVAAACPRYVEARRWLRGDGAALF